MEKKTRAGSLGGAKASFQILISVLFLSSSHLFTIYLSLILGGNLGHKKRTFLHETAGHTGGAS